MIDTDSYTDKNNSDEEDLKSGIPFYNKPRDTRANSAGFAETVETNLEEVPVEETCTTYKYQNWESDDEYGDNRVDSDHSHTTSDSGKYFLPTATTPSYNTTARHHQQQQQQNNTIYPLPEDPVFRPPSTSNLNYSYNYSNPMSHIHSQRQMHAANYNHHLASHPHASHHQPPSHGYSAHPSSYHTNMWYPNAPYSSGSYYSQYGQNRCPTQYNPGYPHDPMVDMLQLSNSGREARNRAEKNRRDKLNGSIQELSTMVPHVAESPRRVDKTAVLRFAAHGLRLQYVFGDALNQPRPQLTDALMKLLDSFCLTVTCHGQIILISSSIEHHLGHCQADLYGQNILHITHPEDHAMLKQHLIPTDLENLFDIQPDDGLDEPRPRTQDEEDYIDRKLREDKRSFTIRLARAGPRSEPTSYEVVKLDGCFKRSSEAPRGLKTSSFPSGLQLIRRTRGREDALPLHTISGNDIVLIAVARIIRPPKVINTLIEANNLEYKTRHLIDGRIIDCDQRIGLVAGYMTDEVRTLSPFTFMHQDDVRWVIVALRQMYDCNSSYGESTYRLLTRNGNFIYLRSKGYLEIDKETNKVHSFVCINTLLDEEEGKKCVQEMKHKFSIIIDAKIPTSNDDVPASAKPQQLEKAVLCLIQNLQKSASSDGEELDSESASTSSALKYNTSNSYDTESHHTTHTSLPARSVSSCSIRSTKTPPLSLVPPETASVRTSISKSVSVVNITAARHLRGHLQQQASKNRKSSEDHEELAEESADNYDALSDIDIIEQHASSGQSYTCSCMYKNDGAECEKCEKQLRKRRISNTNSKRSTSWSDNDEDLKPPKRRLKSTEIQHVLSSSLDQVRRSLDKQLNAAKELRDQSNKYEIPNSNQRIEEWMEEHQKQEEIYVNIKSEYQVQIQNKSIDANTTNTKEPQIADDLKPR